jgi:hypothetical protein
MATNMSRFQPANYAELRDFARDLQPMLKGQNITPVAAIGAALIAVRHYDDMWAAADACEVIFGRPRLTTAATMGVMASSGKVQFEFLCHTEKRVHIRATREGFGTFDSDWTIERATAAGYTKKNPMYNTIPREMLRAKCITEIANVLGRDLVGDAGDEPTPEEVTTVLQEATIVPGTRITSRFADPAPNVPSPAVATYTPPLDLDEAVSRFVVLASEIGHDDDAALAAAIAKMRERPDVCIAWVAACEQVAPEAQSQKIGALLAKYATPAVAPVAATIQPALTVAEPAPPVAEPEPAPPVAEPEPAGSRAEKPGARIMQLIGEALVLGSVEWNADDDAGAAVAEQRVANYIKNLTAAERNMLCVLLELGVDREKHIAAIPGLRLPR